MGKFASVVYLLTFFVVSYPNASPGTLLPAALFALLPLLLVWFPEEIGAWVGASTAVKVARPALWLQRLGWLLFLLLPLFLLI